MVPAGGTEKQNSAGWGPGDRQGLTAPDWGAGGVAMLWPPEQEGQPSR